MACANAATILKFAILQTPRKAWKLLTAIDRHGSLGKCHLDQLHRAADLVWRYTCACAVTVIWQRHRRAADDLPMHDDQVRAANGGADTNRAEQLCLAPAH